MKGSSAALMVLWVLGLMSVSGEDLDLHDLTHKRAGVRLCGEKLIQSLMVICDNKYNKRNHLNYEPEMEVGPWRMRSQALALLARVRRGVADECCSKSCSVRELSSYCAEDK